MDTFEAKALFDQKDYGAVVKFYKNPDEGVVLGEWDYFRYAQSLRKLGDYAEGRKIGREGIIKFPDFEPIRTPYGWCLYYLYVRDFNAETDSEETFEKAVRSILRYCSMGQYTPYENSLWRLLRHLNGKLNTVQAARHMDMYLSLLQPEQLSTEENCFQSKDGKERHTASAQERWYSYKSKVLLMLEDYEGCISLCEEALRTISQFHNDSDCWFGYRIALADTRLGRLDQAEERLQQLLIHKKDWNLYHALFTIYVKKDDKPAALKCASAAMLSPGEDEPKVNLLEETADLLRAQGQEQESYWHILLSKLLREEKQWTVKPELLSRLESYGMEPLDLRTLRQNLRAFWKGNRHQGEQAHSGQIDRLLPDNRAGFIREDGGTSYYFRINNVRKQHGDLAPGMAVQFFVDKSYDNKRQKESLEAVDIEVV